MKSIQWVAAGTFSVILWYVSCFGENSIDQHDFNFGHQSGYMYSRTDVAYSDTTFFGAVETGFAGFYTSEMPNVINPDFQKRLLLIAPLYLEFYPAECITLYFEITDFFVEFPYVNEHSEGGKTPRFKMKWAFLNEGSWSPAIALTMGVTFSSAKPWTIWENRLNNNESNGLAGAGTGETDYLVLFTLSKRLTQHFRVHGRIGIAPLGSPVPRFLGTTTTEYSVQSDEVPYGLTLETIFNDKWSMKNEISGMYNGLQTVKLGHYSVFRTTLSYHLPIAILTLDIEKGLTPSSDEWVLGFYDKVFFGKQTHTHTKVPQK